MVFLKVSGVLPGVVGFGRFRILGAWDSIGV